MNFSWRLESRTHIMRLCHSEGLPLMKAYPDPIGFEVMDWLGLKFCLENFGLRPYQEIFGITEKSAGAMKYPVFFS